MKYEQLIGFGLIFVLAGCMQRNTSTGPEAAGPTTLNVADAAIAGGDPSMALSVSQSVLQSDPNNSDALLHEGDAYYALKRCPDAIAAYTLALKVDPNSSAAQTGLGRCLIKTDPKSAEAALVLAVQDDPDNAAALNDLGIARDLQGNFAGAAGPYRQALLAQPGMTAVEVNYGLSLALSGNGPEALQYLGPLATGPDATPKIRQNYAAALVASGREAEARQVLSIDLPPDQVNSAMQGFSAVIMSSQPSNAVSDNNTQPAAVSSDKITAVISQPLDLAVSAAPQPVSPTAKTPGPPAILRVPAAASAAESKATYLGASSI